jgi:adenylate cyclase
VEPAAAERPRARASRRRRGPERGSSPTPGPVEVDRSIQPAVDGPRLIRRVRIWLGLGLTLANLTGVVVVVACVTWVIPGPPVENLGRLVALNLLVAIVFCLVVVPSVLIWGEAWQQAGRRWLQEGRDPTPREVTAVLHAPFRIFTVHVTAWCLGAVAFTLLNALIDPEMLARVAFTILLGGLTTSAFTYLITEQVMRPVAARALSATAVDRPQLPGVVSRTMIAWALGSGVPLLGVVLTGIFGLVRPRATPTQLSITMIVLGGLGLLVGSWVVVLGARAVAAPLRDLRRVIRAVGDGDLQARAEVYDGSELGLLQAGFNEMATGLEERERLRDLYFRQVGEDVARDSLERGAALGGELCRAAVLFVDVVGSTSLAANRPANEVVDLLNRFFGVVVDEVHRHGGWINKFQGDATLAVFGVPASTGDPAGRALAAARGVARRLPDEVPELGAGVGVAYGPVVAANIGDERRFEFTVIGDPVNEASRLTELAKTYEPMVLASADALRAASIGEREYWRLDREVVLRGRDRPTRLATPAD